MKNNETYIGLKIGQLTLITPIRIKNKNNNYTRAGWICKCNCGNFIKVRTDQLGYGPHLTQSCGCWNRSKNLASSIHKLHQKYQQSDSQPNAQYNRLYNLWKKIKRRCYDPKTPEYKYYGERGIKMYQPWKEDYSTFKKWALSNNYDPQKPRSKQTIDRIDVNKNYTPSNCRWVSMTIQANNKSNTLYIDFYGKKTTIGDLSRKFNINYHTLMLRYKSNNDKNINLIRKPYQPKFKIKNAKYYKKDDEICFIF